MNEVLEFINECGVFFISTVENDRPRVRPFSFIMEYDGKLCFATNNQKPIFNQLKANPNVEISASKGANWIRLSGEAIFCTTKEAKSKALEVMPALKQMYNEEDNVFEVFYLQNAEADFYSLKGDHKSISL